MSIPRLLVAVLFATLAAAASTPAHAAGAGSCAAEKFSDNRVFAACADLTRLGASLHWSYDATTSSLSVAFLASPPSGGWVAWGLNPKAQTMDGTQALVAVPKANGGGYEVQTYSISGTTLDNPGPLPNYQTSNLAAEVAGDGRVTIFGTLKLQNGTGAEVNQVWQVGPYSSGAPQIHEMQSDNMNSKGSLNLLTGATAAASGGSILRQKNVSCLCVPPFVCSR
jgi:hypothetical protein